jgi:two-component system, NtrC family, response regulator AtoC
MALRDTKKSDSSPLSKVCVLPPKEVMFGCSGAMLSLRQKLEKVALQNVPVLIEGEGGTGKELVARWIHCQSPWSSGPFVKVNCAAIPGQLLESELFGYEQGAFTGAQNRKPGRIELAQHGTLLLDDITELDQGLQAKLLHFLQDGTYSRIGATSVDSVETRVICSTSRVLEKEIERGRFRADLFYRINVVRIHMPSLRDRREDVPLLTNHFVSQFNRSFERNAPPLSNDQLRSFQNKDWPGNIRELENLVARYVLLGSVDEPAPQPRPHWTTSNSAGRVNHGVVSLKGIAKEAVREIERKLILDTLRANHWNRRKTAEALRISYRTLIYKIQAANLARTGGSAGVRASREGKTT